MTSQRLLPLLLLSLAVPAFAQDREVPYWATIRGSASELNMRVGPSEDYPISWVYRRPGLPLKVVRVYEGWRMVVDPDGAQGWVSSRLLSPDRGAMVSTGKPTAMRDTGSSSGSLKWMVQAGVVGKLGNCTAGWCRFTVGDRDGWVQENRLWGTGAP